MRSARALALLAIALPAALTFGCLPFGPTGPSQPVQVENAATVAVRVRVGPFAAGRADVPEDKMLAEQVVLSRRLHTFNLPAGRYNIEATAVSSGAETATTNFTLGAQPARLTVQEQLVDEFQPTPPGSTPPPAQEATRKRVLTWFEQ